MTDNLVFIVHIVFNVILSLSNRSGELQGQLIAINLQ